MIVPTKDDIGRTVVYMRGQPPFEEGVITSFNHTWVFVRYGSDKYSKATGRYDLEWTYRVPARIRRVGVETKTDES